MRAMKLTLTGLIIANAALALVLLSGNPTFNAADAQVADRAGEYLGVTGRITQTRDAFYLVNTREDRLCVFMWSDTYKRLDKLANVDLKEAFATAAEPDRRLR